MSAFDALTRRIDRMLALIARAKNTVFHLPVRFLKIDDSGNEEVTYETEPNPNVAYKEYIVTDDWNPDMIGIDP